MSYGNSSHRSSADIPITVFVSVLTSAFVTVGILFFTGNLSILQRDNGSKSQEDLDDEKTVEAPSLKGLTTSVAGDVLRSRGLRLVVQEERADKNIPKGKIAEQDPLAGSELNEGGAIAVVVSTGPGESPVPDVTGKEVDEAKHILTEAGFVVGEISETDTGQPGTVAESKPAKGETAKSGSTIALVVTKAVTVPDVVGKYLPRAKKDLTEAGFKIGKFKWGDSEYKDSHVILEQKPEAGTIVVPGAEIILTVNSD
jgi:eukaryotic-like serine/threonine-protein kinase